MNYQIVEKPAFIVAGKSIRVSMENGENFRLIPQFWQLLSSDGTVHTLIDSAAGKVLPPKTTLGICTEFSPEMNVFTYVIGAEKGTSNFPVNDYVIDVPAASWAIFEASGALPDSLQSIWQRTIPEFFNESGYLHSNGPEVEVYPQGNPMDADYLCEVWVPVVNK